jgi:hypothetical protein
MLIGGELREERADRSEIHPPSTEPLQARLR